MSLKPSLSWLFVFAPAAVVLEIAHLWTQAEWAHPAAIFICACLAIIPAAGWMGRATEHLAERVGEGVGGLLNATFGNAAELIIALMALIEAARDAEKAQAMHDIVKASLTGSIIGNILLVLGLALIAGGWRRSVQTFNVTAARNGATLLMLSLAAVTLPAVFAHAMPDHAQVRAMSLEVSLVLLAVYAASLVFTLRTHKHLYAGQPDAAAPPQPRPAPGAQPAALPEAHWSVRRSIAVLVGATVAVAVLAELMIGSVDAASKAIGLTELFVGVIVVAIVGNAAEHSTAVMVAWRNRMDLSLSIAIGSSIQIALLVAPLLVLLSYALGAPMDLLFTLPEVAAIGIAVLITSQIAGDGQSHWLEGVMLVTVYVILGVLFFHLPG